jgi:hypothetical protein
MESLSKIIIIISLIILLSLLVRYLQNSNIVVEMFNNVSEFDKKKYLANISEEHIEFVLLNVKLGINKYLTVIQHQPFTHNNNNYLPIGQLSVITDEEIPQKSTFFENLIKEKESAHLCASFNSKPIDYQEIWNSSMMYEPATTPFSIWRPIPETGFIALTDIITRGRQKPSTNLMTCIPIEHTVKMNNINGLIWSDYGIECNSVGRSFKKCINDSRNIEIYDLINDYTGIFNDNENKLVISARSN